MTEFKILFISFNLDGILSRIELGDGKRHNRIILLYRNYNGDISVNAPNLINIYGEKLDFYVDYYNENMGKNDRISRELIADVKCALENAITATQLKKVYTISFQSDKYIWIRSSLYCDVESFLKDALGKCLWENIANHIVYPSCITVLPPDIRPDLNPHYCVVQTSAGCRVKDLMGRACYFCSSYQHTRFVEHDEAILDHELTQLLTIYPKSIKRSTYCFFADGDALAASNFLDLVSQTKLKLPNIKGWESFISTHTILHMPSEQWAPLLRSGLNCVYWGVESADDHALQFLGKPQDEQQLITARQILENHGISYAIIAMCGFSKISSPLDLSEHVEKTCAFINKSNCKKVYISKLSILPGTELFLQLKDSKFTQMSSSDMEQEYRLMLLKITKQVTGAYGNQFM